LDKQPVAVSFRQEFRTKLYTENAVEKFVPSMIINPRQKRFVMLSINRLSYATLKILLQSHQSNLSDWKKPER